MATDDGSQAVVSVRMDGASFASHGCLGHAPWNHTPKAVWTHEFERRALVDLRRVEFVGRCLMQYTKFQVFNKWIQLRQSHRTISWHEDCNFRELHRYSTDVNLKSQPAYPLKYYNQHEYWWCRLKPRDDLEPSSEMKAPPPPTSSPGIMPLEPAPDLSPSTPLNMHPCTFGCGKHFKSKNGAATHEKTCPENEGRKIYTCPHCNKKVKHLKNHDRYCPAQTEPSAAGSEPRQKKLKN